MSRQLMLLLSLRRSREQIRQIRVELRREGVERQHRRIARTALQATHDIWVDARLKRECLLAQLQTSASGAHFLS